MSEADLLPNGSSATAPRTVYVRDGLVTVCVEVRDTSGVPVAVRLVRTVEAVVDVDCALLGPPRRPDLDPDFPAMTPGAFPTAPFS